MNRIIKVFLVSSILFLTSCKEDNLNCDKLPKSYSSYEEATEKIKAAHFKVEETKNTSKSSWIKYAEYYSCDGLTGFLILKMKNKEYTFAGVPTKVWTGFKNADSFGKYYHQFIQGNYYFQLN